MRAADEIMAPCLSFSLEHRRDCGPCALLTEDCRCLNTRRPVITWPKPSWPCRTGSRGWRRPMTSLRGTLCFWALQQWRTGWSTRRQKEGEGGKKLNDIQGIEGNIYYSWSHLQSIVMTHQGKKNVRVLVGNLFPLLPCYLFPFYFLQCICAHASWISVLTCKGSFP